MFCVGIHVQGGWVALMSAAYDGHSEVMHMLLSAGADVNARDKVRSRNASMIIISVSCHILLCIYIYLSM